MGEQRASLNLLLSLSTAELWPWSLPRGAEGSERRAPRAPLLPCRQEGCSVRRGEGLRAQPRVLLPAGLSLPAACAAQPSCCWPCVCVPLLSPTAWALWLLSPGVPRAQQPPSEGWVTLWGQRVGTSSPRAAPQGCREM